MKCFQCFAPLDNDCVHYSNSDWLIEPQDCVVIGLSASNIFAQQREIWETGNEKVKKRRQGKFSRASHFFWTSLYSHSLNTDKTQCFFFPDLGFPALKNSTPGKFSNWRRWNDIFSPSIAQPEKTANITNAEANFQPIRSTTDTSSARNLCARSSDLISQGHQWCEMSAVFKSYP